MAELVIVDEPAAQVRRLTLNRPDKLNTMTAGLCEALHSQLRSIRDDRSCRAVIITGAGRGFCAGWTSPATARRRATTAQTNRATGSPTRNTCHAWSWSC